MPHQNQKYLASMIWSSYALEDLGDSFVANPDITGCVTASNTARKGDTIRHVDDQPVTLSCSNKVKIIHAFFYFGPVLPNRLSQLFLWEETGVPGENQRLSTQS